MIKALLLFILSCIRFSFDILRIAIIWSLLPIMLLPVWRKGGIPWFILSCIRLGSDILRMAIFKALLPRMPLPNWRKEGISMVQVHVDDTTRVGSSRIIKLWKRASTTSTGPTNFVNCFECTNGDEDTTRSKVAKSFTEHNVPVDKINVNVTPTKSAVVEFEFSIYSDSSPAHQDTRHPFLTPVCSPIKEVGFTVLRNASDRVTEILRENRRRLDAGEDPNTIRKEARRKRAMELSAIRKGRAKLFSSS